MHTKHLRDNGRIPEDPAGPLALLGFILRQLFPIFAGSVYSAAQSVLRSDFGSGLRSFMLVQWWRTPAATGRVAMAASK